MDLPIVTPLTSNPDDAWLEAFNGPHIMALRLYVESWWALTRYRTIATTPGPAAYWVTLTGQTLHTKPDLFDHALDTRREALLAGFFELDEQHLRALANLPVHHSHQQQLRHEFLRYSNRHAVATDVYGQSLPAPLGQVLLKVESTPPSRKQGLNGVTKRFRLGGRTYYAKLTDETMSGDPLLGQDEYYTVSTMVALRTLCSAIAPAESYHVVAADGSQCSITSAVPGRTYADVSAKRVAGYLSNQWVQWIVLAEWLLGIGDRLADNLIVDKTTSTASIIDTTYGWQLQPKFLGWDEGECWSFARRVWEIQDTTLTFDRGILQSAFAQQASVSAALLPFALPYLPRLQQQFRVVEAALDHQDGNITLPDLEHLAQSMLY